MKFTINSKDFKTAVERVSVCLKNKSLFVINRAVNISANAETGIVTFSVTNFSQAVNVFVKANIIESGETLAEYSIFKRMLNIPGNVTIRTEGKKIIATNGKKTGECCATEWEVDPSYYLVSETTIDNNEISTVDSNEIVDILCNLSKFTSTRDTKPVLCGIYIDTLKHNMVANDGYRMVVCSIDKWKIHHETNIIIPAVVSVQLKKIIGNNTKINLYADKKYFCITADDFTFRTRLIDGEYIDYIRCLPTSSPKITNKMCIDDVIATLKEYKELCKKKIPMGLYFKEDKMYTSVFTKDYSTVDTIELTDYVEPTEEMVIGIYPEYLIDSLQLFKSEKLDPVCCYYTPLSAIKFIDGRYTMIVMPARLENTSYIDKVKKLIA